MKKPIKYICIALTLGVLMISAVLFWPATSSQSPHASAEFQRGMDLINQNRFSEAIEPLTSAFEGGYIEAGYWIGFSYRYITLPFGSPKKERFWYKKGAEAGDPYAMLALGSKYYVLCSVLDECSFKDYYWKWKARRELERREKNGDKYAMYNILRMLDSKKYDLSSQHSVKEYINELKYFALEGNDHAAINYFYKAGKIENKDIESRLKVIKKASEAGGGKSAELLGHQYYRIAKSGINKKQNYDKSIYWLKRSTKSNFRQAYYGLAIMYEGQKELDDHIEDLYYYCRVIYELGEPDLWCDSSELDKKLKIKKKLEKILPSQKRKKINKNAIEWSKSNFLSREYIHFSGFKP